ncbi:MAG TPA: GerMN domain-containing protein [Armatimonadota bacterium]
MNKRSIPIIVSLILISGAAAGIYVVQRFSAPKVETVKPIPTPQVPSPSPENKPEVKSEPVKIYRVVVKGDEPKLQSVEVEPIAGKTPAESAILQMLKEGDGASSANPIPRGTKLRHFSIKNGLATVDFSKEFRDNFNGGSEGESLTVDAILRTLGQFPEIKQVQLLVEGQPLDTLGHLDLSNPLDVNGVGSDFGGGN